MQFLKVVPSDITNLPQYHVPKQLFICSCVMMFLFLGFSIIFIGSWGWRIYKKIFNPDYIIGFAVKYETAQTINMKEAEPKASTINFEDMKKNEEINKLEGRLLEFGSLSVFVAINIGVFTCNVMEITAYLLAVILFTLFNVMRIKQSLQFLKLLFLVPLLAAYLPFYIFQKQLEVS